MVAGGFDNLLKTCFADMAAYRAFAGTVLWQLPGVRKTRTYAVMEEVNYSTRLPVDGERRAGVPCTERGDRGRRITGSKIDLALLDMSTKIAKCGGIKKLEVEEDKERSTDNLRVFKITMTMKSDDQKCGVKNDTIKVFKNDGKWRIHIG